MKQEVKKYINEISVPGIISVSPMFTLQDSVALMSEKKISCLVVTENEQPIGIFTERDLIRLIHEEKIGKESKINEFMNSPVITVWDGDKIYEAYNTLVSKKIRHLVSIDSQGTVMGILSQSDILNSLGFDYFYEKKKVAQVMTRAIVTTNKKASLKKAIELLSHKQVSCLLVEEDDRPVGILTERDIGRIFLQGNDLDKICVEQYMSSPVSHVSLETPIQEATNIMKREKIRRLVVVNQEGEIEGLLTQSDIIKDLSGKYIESLKETIRQKDRKIEETNEYYQALFHHNPDAVYSYDLKGNIQSSNWTSATQTGYSLEEMKEMMVDSYVAPEDKQIRLEFFQKATREKAQNYDIRMLHKKGHEIHLNVTNIPIIYDGQVQGVFGIEKDITDRKMAEEILHHDSIHDELTGIYNRRYLLRQLSSTIGTSKRYGHPLSFCICDLDYFKRINDEYGHVVGDHVLVGFANLLRSSLRIEDIPARYGGDEFCVIFPHILVESAKVSLERIRKSFETMQFTTKEGESFTVSASFGLAELKGRDLSEKELLEEADQALYKGKLLGRNQITQS